MLKPNSLLALLFFVFFFFSCNPDEDDILGLNLIEDDEFFIEKHQLSLEFSASVDACVHLTCMHSMCTYEYITSIENP